MTSSGPSSGVPAYTRPYTAPDAGTTNALDLVARLRSGGGAIVSVTRGNPLVVDGRVCISLSATSAGVNSGYSRPGRMVADATFGQRSHTPPQAPDSRAIRGQHLDMRRAWRRSSRRCGE